MEAGPKERKKRINWPHRNYTLRQYDFAYNHRITNRVIGGSLRNYDRLSPAPSTAADIRKVRRRKNSVCIHFRIQFSYSRPFYFSYVVFSVESVIRIFMLFWQNDVMYPIWTLFCYYFSSIYVCTFTLVVYVNYIILRIDLNSFCFLDIYVIHLVMHITIGY